MSSKTFSLNIPFEIRKAMSICQTIADTVGNNLKLKPLPAGNLLSVKESGRWESEDGESARTTVTCRYEGGMVVKINLSGHEDSHFGFQWSVKGAATIRCYTACSNNVGFDNADGDTKVEFRINRFSGLKAQQQIEAAAKRGGFLWSQKAGRRNTYIFAEDIERMHEEGLTLEQINTLLRRARRCVRFFEGDGCPVNNYYGGEKAAELTWLAEFEAEFPWGNEAKTANEWREKYAKEQNTKGHRPLRTLTMRESHIQ